jgi:ribosomal protein L35AE/L33A
MLAMTKNKSTPSHTVVKIKNIENKEKSPKVTGKKSSDYT